MENTTYILSFTPYVLYIWYRSYQMCEKSQNVSVIRFFCLCVCSFDDRSSQSLSSASSTGLYSKLNTDRDRITENI